jgi:hypothetical protein
LKLAGEMPHGIGSRCFAYLSLFRLPGRSLQWKKVLRLLSELKELATLLHIQWKGQVARPNSASAWGGGMERVIENPPKRLPLKSHGYLRAVAYEIADEMDRAEEVKRNQEERTGKAGGQRSEAGGRKSEARGQRSERSEPERITSEDMKAIRRKNMGKEKFSYEIKDGDS